MIGVLTGKEASITGVPLLMMAVLEPFGKPLSQLPAVLKSLSVAPVQVVVWADAVAARRMEAVAQTASIFRWIVFMGMMG